MSNRRGISRRHFAVLLGGLGTAAAGAREHQAMAVAGQNDARGAGAMNDSDSVKATLPRVRAVLEDHVAKGYAPGMVGLIGTGAEAEVVVVGKTAKGGSTPMRRDSLFRIASMTKPITAVATMMLVEAGTLRLDEPVDRLLPELANRRVLKRIDAPLTDTVAASRPITVQDLLTFQCGLGIVLVAPDSYPIQRKISELQLLGFGAPDPAAPLAPDEWIKRLGTLPLMTQPGDRWMYNTGSYVLGVLIARASGRSFPQFLEERVLGPLGMTDTGFFVPPGKLSRLVDAYRPKDGKLELYDPAGTSLWGTAPAFPDGGAGLVSTADDYLAFARFMAERGHAGGRQLLSEASIAAMTRDHLTASQREGGFPVLEKGRGWALGLSVVAGETEARLPIGTFGWSGGLGTSWMTDPQSGRTGILLTQTMFTSPEAPAVHEEFWRVVFSENKLDA